MFKNMLEVREEVLEMCRKCSAFRYNNGWHFDKPRYLKKYDPEEKIFVRFIQCSSCVEEALAMHDVDYA